MYMRNDSEVCKKVKYMNKLGIVFKNQNFCKKLSILMPIPKNLLIFSILNSD